MEEELSENELEEQMYAMIHYVDETQKNISTNPKDFSFLENVPHSNIRRYWCNSGEYNTTYQKLNASKESVAAKTSLESSHHKGKDENNSSVYSVFQQPVPQNIKKTIEILENEDQNRVVELETSDEDEVIEIALSPKPTITIESSDEDVCAVSLSTTIKKTIEKPQENKIIGNREVTASPVPSVVSSISDEFIRGDCIALNISSKNVNNQSFDFSLHGTDLLIQTPTKKRKKKRNKDASSTPIATPANSTSTSLDECFATPKSKAKNKRQKLKSYRVSEKSIPNADVYDSDSNQSTNEGNKNHNVYTVTDRSLSGTDVYESDSNQSEIIKESTPNNAVVITNEISNNSNTSATDVAVIGIPTITKKNSDTLNKSVIVDLTELESSKATIDENIVMGNVSGFTEEDDYTEENLLPQEVLKCGSTKIPAILNEDLDFDNLKGNNKTCKKRRYSLSTLRVEMEKFYNESWGGEDFNHREIQKNMSRDKSLWVIDPKDRMSSISKRKIMCTYCNRVGHRDDTCRMKPPICYMCGSSGHFEPRCPRKICVNCGSPNYMYSTMCRNCSTWHTLKCSECGQNGHPSSHCPDVWRRYHNTVDSQTPLEENRQFKKHYQLFCSGCTRRGHLVHTCRISLPFSLLPINSPYVAVYRPVYPQIQSNDLPQNNAPNDQPNKQLRNKNISQVHDVPSPQISKNDRLKRQSKSPVVYDTHLNKKRHISTADDNQISQRNKSPINDTTQRKHSQTKEQPPIIVKDATDLNKNSKTAAASEIQEVEKAPDFISILPENRDKKGQMIQDNEVSDTSEVVTSARIYVTKDIVDKLRTDEGVIWMKETIKNNNIILESDNINFYLSIKGTVGNQEAFQTELRDWISKKQQNKERPTSESEPDVIQESTDDHSAMSNDIPKNRNNVLRKLGRAFESLKSDIGDPKALYRELVFLQNKHQQLLKQKVISPQQVSNNRHNINGMLRKLNMVLLGQAGLADGSKHLSELHVLQEKLTNFRQKNIPTSLREEIGQHFHCIFAAIPRNDYVELLSKFYNKPAPVLKNKNNDNLLKLSPISNQKSVNPFQRFEKNVNINKKNGNRCNDGTVARPLVENTKNKLVFYHKRLLRSKPMDIVLKKTKNELVKKLGWQIASLRTNTHTTKKSFKKIKKVQQQAQLFLTNV